MVGISLAASVPQLANVVEVRLPVGRDDGAKVATAWTKAVGVRDRDWGTGVCKGKSAIDGRRERSCYSEILARQG